MVLTGEGRLGPDIWPETLQQADNIENMRATNTLKHKSRVRPLHNI